jgi:hypothetical protein
MSDVTDALDRMIAGETTVEEVAEEFRARAWPRRERAETRDATDLYRLDASDPEEDPDGAFSEVAGYHAMHRIDDAQYAVLAEAAAEAMKDAPAPGTPAGSVNEGTTPA